MRAFWLALAGAIAGPRTWAALCLSALAMVMLTVGGLDAQHGESAVSLHHAGVTLLAWTWAAWLLLALFGRLRR